MTIIDADGFPAECQYPQPPERVAAGGRPTCDYWSNDSIHGPWEECEEAEGVPCINPGAHHRFVWEVSDGK